MPKQRYSLETEGEETWLVIRVPIVVTPKTLVVRGPMAIEIEESPDADPEVAGLTPTERQVFEMMRRGKCNKEIAVALGNEIRTTKAHVSNVFRKLVCESRAEVLLKYGIRARNCVA